LILLVGGITLGTAEAISMRTPSTLTAWTLDGPCEPKIYDGIQIQQVGPIGRFEVTLKDHAINESSPNGERFAKFRSVASTM